MTSKEQRDIMLLEHASQLGHKIVDAWTENKRINANIKALRIATSASLQMHAQRMQLMEKTIIMVFGERNTALQKQYEALDHGMETGDREVILTALKDISDIVVSNPLEDVAKIAMTLRDPREPLQLDF